MRHGAAPPPHWSDHSQQQNSRHIPASSDLTREGDSTFISIPCHLTMWHFPFEGTVALLQLLRCETRAFIILFWARRSGEGDEGRDFFLTRTHQSGKKRRVDRCVKRVLLGQLGNFRDQFRRLQNIARRGRSNGYAYGRRAAINTRVHIHESSKGYCLYR